MTNIPNMHALEVRKILGAFYTPTTLSQALTEWAVVSDSDTILEPSFGGCGFLEAVSLRLLNLGCLAPESQIFGCDIDPLAFYALEQTFKAPTDSNHFIQKDFMEINVEDGWNERFSVSVGNPPYISGSKLTLDQRNNYAARWKSKYSFKLAKKASLWAHFLIQAVSFIRPGGRLAWVLPGSLLQADYAQQVRDFIAANFENVICILMQERFFISEGTEEETVILLAKNKISQINLSTIAFAYAESTTHLSSIIKNWDRGPWTGAILNDRPAYLYTDITTTNIYESLLSHPNKKKLGDLVKVHIGIVTGENSFFAITEKKRQELNLSLDDLRPIFTKFRASKGLEFKQDDHSEDLEKGGRAHLVHTTSPAKKGSTLAQYLESFSQEKIDSNRTFEKRTTWHAPDDDRIPDLFLSVMNHDGPRIVLNTMKINCTNTIHRGYFIQPTSETHQKLLTISMLTSFSQLSAEFVGRRYGSGVLKHEPSEMKKISLLMQYDLDAEIINNYFKEIDKAYRTGQRDRAMNMADELIIHRVNNGKDISEKLQQALKMVRRQRQRK
jgi:adenine-specific DNA methylase